MPGQNHTAGRAVIRASIDNTAAVKHQIDLGRSYTEVTVGIQTGLGDALLAFPASSDDLTSGHYAPTGGAPRLGATGGSYVQWLHFGEGPYRHFCFVWETGGVTGANLIFLAQETGTDVEPQVTVSVKTETKVA